MTDNTKNLISTLHGTPLLDSRYCDIRVVNRDPATGKREGMEGSLSVIFKATDQRSGNDVAIKFFDPDIQGFSARYRMDLFERESRLLERLQNNDRCLQLVQPLSEIPITMTDRRSGRSITIKCGYLVLEWLDGSVAEYFMRQQRHEAKVKLLLFRNIVLGTFALHRQSIIHRDLKQDNLRQVLRNGRDIVVALDLGTAVDLTSPQIGSARDYAEPVGASAFAPIEAHAGLSGVRELLVYTDIYGLGCLLHDLFNAELFLARAARDPGFNACLGACYNHMKTVLQRTSDSDELVREWKGIIQLTRGQVSHPGIRSATTSVPAGIRDQMDVLLRSLTDVDYRRRTVELDKILRRIDSACRALDNRLVEERARARRAERRRRREIKANRRQLYADAMPNLTISAGEHNA
ncbi:MAG: hypothetical protein GKR94_17375 [Gammaproteobacteria bacterium]|nr:hypothetical protein [Gammaproteobacteria bacterium]